jgi:hypothetical protein
MLLKLISQYYIYLWLMLVAVLGLKILLSFVFNKNLEGFQGLLYSIFKWYNTDDKDLAESDKKRVLMTIYNSFTISIYLILGFIILFSILPMFITV